MDKEVKKELEETVSDFIEDIDILRERAGSENHEEFDSYLKRLMNGTLKER